MGVRKEVLRLNKRSTILLFIASILIITGSATAYFLIHDNNSDAPTIEAFDDVRQYSDGYPSQDISGLNLRKSADIIPTLTFNTDTQWPSRMPPGCEPSVILENAKNPGLGVRELHQQGIVGKGIIVAIIDQPMYLDHPEFEGKVMAYKDFDCQSESSMHGPAVTSLLVGNTIGTAPGAHLYYAATPFWLGDAGYFADALEWIMKENRKLPEDNKIRVVSVSAAPSGEGSFFTKNNERWDEAVRKAEEAGMIVLDCTTHHGFIFPCYHDEGDPEQPSSYKGGSPSFKAHSGMPGYLFVPTSPRTTAEEYSKGNYKYQYTGQGGQSWAIPYVAGVLAMGWQINPLLTSEQMIIMLFESAYKADTDIMIIDPPAFIDLVKNTVG